MYNIKNLTVHRYPSSLPVLNNLNLESGSNESISIIGSNGSGKTTFAYSLIGLIPFYIKGNVSGKFSLEKTNVFDLSFQERIKKISYVFQDVESQILFGNVKDVLGLNDKNTYHTVIYELVRLFNVGHLLEKKPNELSSGESQKVALISATRNNPKLIIYDEATTALDHQTKKKFAEIVRYLLESGKSILLLGQNGKLLNEYASKTFYVQNNALSETPNTNALTDTYYNELESFLPTSVKDYVNLININHIVHSYKNWIYNLEISSFSIQKGETIAIIGENGSGKSTFVNCLNGYLRPKVSEIEILGGNSKHNIFNVFSSPSVQLCEPRIGDELARANMELPKNKQLVQKYFPFLDFEKDPFELSFGEQRVLTFLQAAFSDRGIIIVDEPELGVDEVHYGFFKYIFQLNIMNKNRIIIYITHDLKLAENYSSRVLMFDKGKIVKDKKNTGLSLESWFES